MDRNQDFEVAVQALSEVGEAIKGYAFRVGDATSQLANVALLFGDNPNESISSRSYRCRDKWYWNASMVGIDFLFRPLGREHCKQAYLRDLQRASEMIAR